MSSEASLVSSGLCGAPVYAVDVTFISIATAFASLAAFLTLILLFLFFFVSVPFLATQKLSRTDCDLSRTCHQAVHRQAM